MKHSTPLRARYLLPLFAAATLLANPLTSHAGIAVGVSINLAPPELPVYEQPEVPGPGYIWAPGYWAWGDDGYFWVPGTWVLAPQPGYLWTPGYWAFVDGGYFFHEGYWGPHVGFYGGVNYGYGYGGRGYEGGYWNHGAFYYNRSVNHIGNNVQITNVYNKTVINNVSVTRVSYNGGGGVHVQPTPQELAVQHEHHLAPTGGQIEHVHSAATNPAFQAKVNHGMPAVGATPRVEAAGPRDTARPGAAPQARTDRPAAQSQQAHADRPAGATQPVRTDRPPSAMLSAHTDRPAGATQPARTDRPAVTAQPARADRPPAAVHQTQQPHAQAPHGEAPRAEAPRAEAPRRAPVEHRAAQPQRQPENQRQPEQRRPEEGQR
jgi:hypothetical protein